MGGQLGRNLMETVSTSDMISVLFNCFLGVLIFVTEYMLYHLFFHVSLSNIFFFFFVCCCCFSDIFEPSGWLLLFCWIFPHVHMDNIFHVCFCTTTAHTTTIVIIIFFLLFLFLLVIFVGVFLYFLVYFDLPSPNTYFWIMLEFTLFLSI